MWALSDAPIEAQRVPRTFWRVRRPARASRPWRSVDEPPSAVCTCEAE